MRAFMSSGPLSPATEYAYLAIVRDTPFRENAWERVAIAEARAILAETESDLTHFEQGAGMPFPLSSALADALTTFLSMEIN